MKREKPGCIRRSSTWGYLVLACMLSLLSTQARAQSTVALFTVTLFDSDNTVINRSDAVVNLLSAVDGTSLTASADTRGRFIFSDVPSGEYFVFAGVDALYPGQFYHPERNTEEPDWAVAIESAGPFTLDFFLVPDPLLGPSSGGTLPPTTTTGLEGEIVDEVTYMPIGGATVSVHDLNHAMVETMATKADGAFSFSTLPAGEYFVSIEDPIYPLQWFHFTGNTPEPFLPVLAGDFLYVEMTMNPEPATSFAKAKLLDSYGAPVDLVQYVYLVSPDDEMLMIEGSRSRTEPGVFEFNALKPGNYWLEIGGGEYPIQYYDPNGNTANPSYTIGLGLNDSIAVDVNMTMAPSGNAPWTPPADTTGGGGIITAVEGGGFEGQVLNVTTRQPVAGVSIHAFTSDFDFFDDIEYAYSQWMTVTDANGQYTMQNVQPGTYIVLAKSDTANLIGQFYNMADSRESARVLTVDTSMVSGINFELREGGRLIGTVVSDNGAPIPDFFVEAHSVDGPHRRSGLSDANGTFVISGLRSGRYRVEVQGYDYFPPRDTMMPEYEITEGQTVTGDVIRLEQGGTLAGRISAPSTVADLWDVRMLLFPPSISWTPHEGEVLWPFWVPYLNMTPTGGGDYVTAPCPKGDWKVIFPAPPINEYDNVPVPQTEMFRPWLGWTSQSADGTIGSAPIVTINSGGTASGVDVTFREGYSVFGTFTGEGGETFGYSALGDGMWFWVTFMVKDGDLLYPIAEMAEMPEGRFEMPGLIDGEEYFVEIGADGYHHRFWSPTSGNSAYPIDPYVFSTSNFVPLDIMITRDFQDNPPPPPPDDGEPISLSVQWDYQTSPQLLIHLSTAHTFESLEIHTRDRNGATTMVPMQIQAGTSDYTWTETRDPWSMRYEYVAVGKTADRVFRSHIMDQDIRTSYPVPPESLWIDVFASPWGIQVEYGGGWDLNHNPQDTAFIYRRLGGTSQWSTVEVRPFWHGGFNDWDWHDYLSVGQTFEYKVELRVDGRTVRSSGIGRFTLTNAALDLFDSQNGLDVGPNEEHTTIQSAVDAAQDFDMIWVQTGTYAENINFKGKILTIEGCWEGGLPPVLDAGGGTAFSIPYVKSVPWNRVSVRGFKIQNARYGIVTLADVEVGECLFVGTREAVRTSIDSAGMAAAMTADPFVRNQINVNLWRCTLIGDGANFTLASLGAVGEAEADGYTGEYQGLESTQMSPIVSLSSNFHLGQSILYNYNTATFPVSFSGNTSYASLWECDFWLTTMPLPTDRVHMDENGEELNIDPQFIDTEYYFLPDNSPLRSVLREGESVGYDERRFWDDKYDDFEDGPMAVTGLRKDIAGLNAIQLNWIALPTSENVAQYVIYRVPGDTSLFHPTSDGQWEYEGDEDSIAPVGMVTGTSFLDTTVELNTPYLYVVAAMDSAGHHGEVSLPYPPPLSAYIIEISHASFAGVHSRALQGGMWHMVGPWGWDSLSFAASPAQQIYRWDDLKPPDKLLAQYEPSTSMSRSDGHWFWSDHDTTLSVGRASFDRLANSSDNVTISLVRGETGWNQISSPFPFPVAPRWLQDFHPNAWSADERRYDGTINALVPWKAVWVYTEKDTVLRIHDKAFLGSVSGFAKTLSSALWELQVSLVGEGSADPDNYIGVLSPEQAQSERACRLEPPQAFGYPQLFFMKSGETQALSKRASDKLARHYMVSQAVPSHKLEWMTAVSPSSEDMTIRFAGLEGVPEEVFVFWVNSDTAVNLREAGEVRIPAHNQTVYGYVLATADPFDIALYTNRFALKRCYPNPFAHATTVDFVIPYAWRSDGSKEKADERRVTVSVYNIAGQKVAMPLRGKLKAGFHRLVWNGTTDAGRMIATGFYILRLESDEHAKTARLVKIR